MGWIRTLYGSAVGKKIVMALTGLVAVGFVLGHMLGNLLVFRGPEAMNAYAELLKSNMALLWTVRAVLLGAIALHIHAAWSLTRMAAAARPSGYAMHATQAATFSSRTMRIGGVVLVLFIVFHLLHLTVGSLHPAHSPTDVYNNVMIGLSVPAVAVFYVVAMASLGMHLHHGVWSLFQTLGWNHPHINPLRRRVATVLAVVVALGFAAVPVAVGFGLIG